MKNIKMLAIVMVLTAGTVFAQKKKVAVVTFYAEKQIDMSDVGMADATVIAGLLKDPTFNLKPMIEKYHEVFFRDFATKFPFDLVPESEVINDTEYKSYKPDLEPGYAVDLYEPYPGYIPMNHVWGKENKNTMVKIFNEYDGVLFVHINFSLEKGFGIGGTATTKMRAYTNITLYNKNGDKVFRIDENANSKMTGVMVGGAPVMKPEKLIPMCESALNELMEDLNKRIKKIIDKSAKKL